MRRPLPVQSVQSGQDSCEITGTCQTPTPSPAPVTPTPTAGPTPEVSPIPGGPGPTTPPTVPPPTKEPGLDDGDTGNGPDEDNDTCYNSYEGCPETGIDYTGYVWEPGAWEGDSTQCGEQGTLTRTLNCVREGRKYFTEGKGGYGDCIPGVTCVTYRQTVPFSYCEDMADNEKPATRYQGSYASCEFRVTEELGAWEIGCTDADSRPISYRCTMNGVEVPLSYCQENLRVGGTRLKLAGDEYGTVREFRGSSVNASCSFRRSPDGPSYEVGSCDSSGNAYVGEQQVCEVQDLTWGDWMPTARREFCGADDSGSGGGYTVQCRKSWGGSLWNYCTGNQTVWNRWKRQDNGWLDLTTQAILPFSSAPSNQALIDGYCNENNATCCESSQRSDGLVEVRVYDGKPARFDSIPPQVGAYAYGHTPVYVLPDGY